MGEGGDRIGTVYRTTPSHAVVEAVAEAEGVRPEELAPPEYDALHDVIDPQALDDLFAPKRNGIARGSGRVAFSYCGYDVTVESDGSVTVE